MANFKEIRIRISSVKSTKQITSAMKMVAAAKLRKAQDKIVQLRPYANKLHEILVELTKSLVNSEEENVYSRKGEPEKVLLIVVTSNKGLCGAFSSNVIREAKRIIEEKYFTQQAAGNLWVMPIGKKGNDAMKRLNVKILEDNSKLFNDLTFVNTSLIAGSIMEKYVKGDFDRVEFVYNQFKNAAVQNLTNEVFLPVETSSGDAEQAEAQDYIYEPGKESIVEDLIPQSLKIQFYKTVLDSFVAEHGARMTAMHKATDNATELIRELTLQYNKARQASITSQILEVVSGAEALRG
jgi:F-type H+-transporting ATPase subunit gamma